ncbi:MAG: site-specific integrase [Pirellulales bacterium]|nr:site-specific integrase [Pirellulales bacterium]
MPRLSQAVPKYQKHRASGQAVVTINGRDYYLGPHGATASKVEYDRLITEWLASGRSASYGTPAQSLTVVEMLADYVTWAASRYGKDTRGEYGHIIRCVKPLKELYGRTSAADFGVLEFKTVRHSIAQGKRSSGYVNEIMRRIVAAFKWAAGEGKLPASVPQNLAIIPGLRKGEANLPEPEPIGPVDDAVIDATLPHLPDVVADMVRLQRLTGMRPAEVCILRPCDLDRSGDVWVYKPAKHKTEHHGRERLILIGPKAQAILLRYLARGSEDYCFRPCDSEAKRRAARHAARRTPLSCGNKPGSNRRIRPRTSPGNRYTPSTYRRAINRACDKAFPHPTLGYALRSAFTAEQEAELVKWQSDLRWSPNQLRHTAATEVRRQFGLEAAQIVLGHSKADVTQVYAERDLEKGVLVARAIG